MWPFAQRPAKVERPRIQSLAEMIVYALTSEVTRGGWKVAKDRTLTNAALGLSLRASYRGSASLDLAKGRNGEIPFDWRDQGKITSAMVSWNDWNDAERRTAELLNFVDAFEKVAAQAGEARRAETENTGSVQRARGRRSRCAQQHPA